MMGAIEKAAQALARERVRRLERALAGALKAGDAQADELIRLARVSARQRRALWRALNLIKRGRPNDAALVMETVIDPEPAR